MFNHEAGRSRGWSLAAWTLVLHSFEDSLFNWAGKVDFYNEALCSQTRAALFFFFLLWCVKMRVRNVPMLGALRRTC
jgi:hypothetical protein